jgi:hypothetical protein
LGIHQVTGECVPISIQGADEAEPKTPVVFISSAFRETQEHLGSLRLRQLIIDEAKAFPVKHWAYEIEFCENPASDVDEVIGRCFSGIRACDLFVFLQTGRHGSSVEYIDDPILSSYLELELFAAALWGKQILVLQLVGHEAPAALNDAVVLLSHACDGQAVLTGDERELCAHFRTACRALLGANERAGVYASARLPDGLSRRRTRRKISQDIQDPALLFLGGLTSVPGKRANVGRAQALLEQVGARDTPTDRQKALPHGATIFRLWAALRELMDEDGESQRDPLLAPLWDRAMGRWASSASWLGVHGFVVMGPLAAINSQIRLRRQFATDGLFHRAADVREPVGARASALYSIAFRLYEPERRVFHYREVEVLATKAMQEDGDISGALTIRGLAALRMAQLGRPWKIWDGERDLREALRRRARAGAAPRQIGESKVNLGFLWASTFRRRSGFQLMEEGVELMRGDPSAGGMSFLQQGLRKLEYVARRSGRLEQAARVLDEIKTLTKMTEAFDQARISDSE